MTMNEITLTGDLQGALLQPELRSGLGVVVLAGSSGRVDVGRASLFAAKGATTIALRWFGGDGQIPGICEIPLETFTRATDGLVEEGCKRIAYVGTSKGAEAALLAAIYDPRVEAVVAISPSSVVWANIGAGRDGAAWPQRSSWTREGVALPFIAYDPSWRPTEGGGPISYRGLHEQSLVTFAAKLEDATIQVETARASMLLVAGGDDALWPSDVFARSIADRLKAARKHALLVQHAHAGHRVLLPGEPATPRPAERAWGGNDDADQELGRAAWWEIVRLFRLPS